MRPLGISCAAIWAVDSDSPLVWHGRTIRGEVADLLSLRDASHLVDLLAERVRHGYTIVTWNGVGFDFDVLAEESGRLNECRHLALDHVDMMFHVLCRIGYGISLDAAARGTGIAGKPKSISGVSSPILWAEGRRKEVLDYVTNDARITLQLATICETRRCLRWVTRTRRVHEMPLPEGWQSVKSAERFAIKARWMGGKWSRNRFTAWMR